MPEEKAKSAIDEIFLIAEKLDMIQKQLTVVDNNIKLLNNKVSKLSKRTDEAPSPGLSASAPRVNGPSASASSIAKSNEMPARTNELVIGDIKLFGYIQNKTQNPIKGVNITIYDSNGVVVKEKVSNNDGFWSVRLPPGKYGVEYNHQFGKRKFKPINRTVELTEQMKELEVI